MGPVPPLADATALPLVAPLHKGSVAAMLAVTGVGSVRAAVAVAVQLLASLTVTLMLPAPIPVTLLPLAVPPDHT